MTDDEHRQLVARWRALNEAAEPGGPLDALGPNATVGPGATAATLPPSRQRLHATLIDDLLTRPSGVRRDGEALVLGGFPGSGKSTICDASRSRSPVTGSFDDVEIDPDRFKVELLEVMASEPPPALAGFGLDPATIQPGDLATLVHRESVLIAHLAVERAARERLNLVVGTTMARHLTALALLALLPGYRVRLLVVDADADEARRNIFSRWSEGVTRSHARGVARFLPEAVIRSQQDATGRTLALDVAERLVREGDAAQAEIWINRRHPSTGVWDTRLVRRIQGPSGLDE